MASAPTLVSVEEYLRTSYSPDCDYVDGVLEKRNLGERDHSWIQAKLIILLMSRFRETGIAAMPEWRVQTRPSRFRIPDVTVVRGKPDEKILTKPPLLCIEIPSPDDRLSRVNARIKEYLDFGVPAVWLVDPEEKKVWIYRQTGMEEASGNTLRLDGTELEFPLGEIFD
jgi:Uma2 family endonuclease